MQITVHENEPRVPEAAPLDLSKVTDAKGRVLIVKQPDILMQARFERLFGADNDNYRLIMGTVTWVRSIDGETLAQPTSVLQYEALLQRIGEDALTKVVERVALIKKELDSGDVKAEIKNS